MAAGSSFSGPGGSVHVESGASSSGSDGSISVASAGSLSLETSGVSGSGWVELSSEHDRVSVSSGFGSEDSIHLKSSTSLDQSLKVLGQSNLNGGLAMDTDKFTVSDIASIF